MDIEFNIPTMDMSPSGLQFSLRGSARSDGGGGDGHGDGTGHAGSGGAGGATPAVKCCCCCGGVCGSEDGKDAGGSP